MTHIDFKHKLLIFSAGNGAFERPKPNEHVRRDCGPDSAGFTDVRIATSEKSCIKNCFGAFPKNLIISKFCKTPVLEWYLAQTYDNIQQMRQKIVSVLPVISEHLEVKDRTIFARTYLHKDLKESMPLQ